ncbi:MAG: acylamino-acid-releasing enzyme [uncultured Thermomicrobiales bacterium]|uniref:Acylamino-acid-releasing enzyme n=1 Tax=uncultured Thermomicrobiales bacterium TaxID=1645740 RepID=A0A6J4UBW2_9BACT|nr:MAG: acylamino-acid-releasing enzyme [uncultured Thermomicrobiales bacterium]
MTTQVTERRTDAGAAEPGPIPFSRYAAIRRYQPTLALTPDGQQVVYSTNVSGQFNLWRQPASGGYARQLTLFDDQTVRSVACSPDGRTLVFSADRAGDEFTYIYRLPITGGAAVELFGRADVQAALADAPFSPSGNEILISANDRVDTDEDVVIRDLHGAESGRPLADGNINSAVGWSPDGNRISYVQIFSNTDLNAGVIDLAAGSSRVLTPHEGEAVYYPGPWAPDSSGFYVVTNEGGEFNSLAFLDVDTGERRPVATPDWDVEGVATAAGGRYLAVVVNEDGYSRLTVHDLGARGVPAGPLTDETAVALPPMPDGTIGTLVGAADAPVFALLISRPESAPEVFTLDLTAGTLTQLTESMLGGIDPATMIRPELIRFTTHDGLEVPAWLYRPAGPGPFPVVLSIHGGPEAQERPSYGVGLYQYLLSRGIGVMAPNVRGSTGYGKAYQKRIHHDWGGAELEDFRAAAEYLKGLDWVDGDRLGVYGGSFGGFATLSCVSRLPEYWAAAVDIVGPSNLVTFAKAVPPTWRRMMAAWVGDPETEVDFLMSRSPITYVDQIRAPLFVIQGANDPRVVKAESDQIVARLRERNVDVTYDVYEDEGHGFTKRSNELRAYGDTVAFFERHLLADAEAPTAAARH